jgi:SAM-dependent methyltransferase
VDVLRWIEQELRPEACTSEKFIYDDMDSQSDRSLPMIYQPFDAGKKSHWRDRGSLFDYLFSTKGKRLLDFGPGDGWPSLIVAPFVGEIVGVEGSVRRVEVCTQNAKRLGITNAKFTLVQPGKPLLFPDNAFDGVLAANSVEETPDPKAALQEIFRVLRPGGRLRIAYDALGRYKNGREREAWLWQINDHTCRLILFDRHLDQECVDQYGITFAMSCGELRNSFSKEGSPISFDMVTVESLRRVRSAIIDARICSLTHPSGETVASWLNEVGFREIIPSHSGADLAGRLYDELSEGQRPKDIEGLDMMLRPLVKIAVKMRAPLGIDPMITAAK